jgi:hypothetical protein
LVAGLTPPLLLLAHQIPVAVVAVAQDQVLQPVALA